MNTLLFSTTIALCLMIGSISCQEEEDRSLLNRFKDTMKNFWNNMKDMWGDLKQEVKARTTDMRDWPKEIFQSLQQKWKELVDQASGASDAQRSEMIEYLERMEMKEE